MMQVGIDLHPLRTEQLDDRLWLEALIWPEFSERAQLLRRAIAMAQQTPPRIVAGDAFEMLPGLVDELPDDTAVCVCHCHTLNQFSPEHRARFDCLLAELGNSREVYQLSAEWINTESPEFTAYRYHCGRKQQRLLAKVNDWSVQWLDNGAGWLDKN